MPYEPQAPNNNAPDESWLDDVEQEGQLAVDVYQTGDEIVIKATIAGAEPEDIDVFMSNDMLTVRGKRHRDETVAKSDYLYRECYWGAFSRSIILPVEVNADKIEASMKNGVLTIKLPKAGA